MLVLITCFLFSGWSSLQTQFRSNPKQKGKHRETPQRNKKKGKMRWCPSHLQVPLSSSLLPLEGHLETEKEVGQKKDLSLQRLHLRLEKEVGPEKRLVSRGFPGD